MTYLLDLSKMQRELKEHTYEFQPSTNFVINERGKTRPITGEQIRDRIAKHSLCDEVLTPAIKDHLIYNLFQKPECCIVINVLFKQLHEFVMSNVVIVL